MATKRKTANEQLLDRMIAHQIGLTRLSGSVSQRIVKLLDATEAELARDIIREADRLQGRNLTDSFTLRRMKFLQEAVADMRGAAVKGSMDLLVSEMRALVRLEPAFASATVKNVVPVILDLVLPDPSLLRALVSKSPFEGKLLKEWGQSLRRADLERIVGAFRTGMVRGLPSNDIARRIIGTARLSGRNGVTQISRNNAVALTRTAVNYFSNAAREEFFNANVDVLPKELYVATLDARTTAICRSLDGKIFDVGHGPIPPLHFSCRSLRVAAVDGGAIGNRPFKSSTTRELLDEWSEQEGLGSISSRDDLPRGTKTAFDEFARRRVRELTGTVPASTTYQEFLRGQTVAFQEEVLGKTKARLFRRGQLTLDKFVNVRGDELTLRQLALRERAAFEEAGLDPDDYLD